ncbi:hypothetical protein BpHYR1_010358 [Brachionus plicatilis]|uniref:Uncharacterized protein n=1 Tax=Brachionus plicatilis TaxID=10195 RepID=A0A3M7QDT6_BRAPC|nr:hypothetical protein BpHYR1_010358 [Brachionus plicatilis]
MFGLIQFLTALSQKASVTLTRLKKVEKIFISKISTLRRPLSKLYQKKILNSSLTLWLILFMTNLIESTKPNFINANRYPVSSDSLRLFLHKYHKCEFGYEEKKIHFIDTNNWRYIYNAKFYRINQSKQYLTDCYTNTKNQIESKK